ncbi:MAG: hypothetical protein ACRDKV_09175 [Solirubrobacterales bacterium]
MRRLIGLAALVGLLWMVEVPGASAGYWRHCGSQSQLGAGWYKVRAHSIGCPKARAVARRYTFAGDRTPYRFRCGDRVIGEELAAVRCGRAKQGGKQRVAFQVGA